MAHVTTECLQESDFAGSDSSVSLKVDPLLLRVSDKSVGERGGTPWVALQTLVGTEGLATAVTGGNSKCRVALWTNSLCEASSAFHRSPAVNLGAAWLPVVCGFCQAWAARGFVQNRSLGCAPCRLCGTGVALRLSSEIIRKELHWPAPVSLVSFLLSLLTFTLTLRSSQCYLVSISSHFLFPFSQARRSH